MALGELWLKVPASLRFVFDGALQPMVTGKDLILHTIGQIGVDGALYKAMEFTGETIRTLPIDDRFTICNMAVEAGAKNGIIAADEITMQYLEGRMRGTYLTFSSDPDAAYETEYRWDASAIEPLVAQPFLPSNVVPASTVKNVKVDQVVIGSCTNGRISDLRAAAQVMKGKKAARGVRVVVFPATQQIYLEAMKEGLLETFVEAGAMISPPICGPCLGGHMGLLADGEVAVSTTNRNFVGRMGHKNSKVYLASPYTAAASAVAGYIIDPRQVS
jgi:3-isopropylmalate/(R)-2-methylmalate dehydratase large subunit